jgi:5'-3' exonuclease
VQQLQHRLAQAKHKELKLKVVNNQLSNMLVSSSQASQRKTMEFINRVEDIIQLKIDKLNKSSTKKPLTHTISSLNTKKAELSMKNTNMPQHEKRWSNFSTRSSARELERTIDK